MEPSIYQYIILAVAIVFPLGRLAFMYKSYKEAVADAKFTGSFAQYLSQMKNKKAKGATHTPDNSNAAVNVDVGQAKSCIPAEQHIAQLATGTPMFALLANTIVPGSQSIPLYAQGETYLIGVKDAPTKARTSYQTNLPLLIPNPPINPPMMFYFELDIITLPPGTDLGIGFAQKPWQENAYPGESGVSVGVSTKEWKVRCAGDKVGKISNPPHEDIRSLGICLEHSPAAVRIIINGRAEESWRFELPSLSTLFDLWPTVACDQPGAKLRLLWDGKRTRWTGPGGDQRNLDTGFRFFENSGAGIDDGVIDMPPMYNDIY